jgi:hypothetical protein
MIAKKGEISEVGTEHNLREIEKGEQNDKFKSQT